MMNDNALQHREIVAAGIFVVATSVLLFQIGSLMTPSAATITIGDSSTQADTLQPSFQTLDEIILAIAAFVSGASTIILLLEDQPSFASAQGTTNSRTADAEQGHAPTDELLDARRQDWEEIADRLANNEQIVYETVLNADGVLPQSEIVEQTDFSKATISRTLDNLEARELIERKRRGVGNVVILS